MRGTKYFYNILSGGTNYYGGRNIGVATQLVQERVVSLDLVEAVNRQDATTSQKNVAILDAVWASIHSDPERFEIS